MTDNQTFNERVAAYNATLPQQTGRFRVATQAGPGTMSATILYDSHDHMKHVGVYTTRAEAIAERDRLNAPTLNGDRCTSCGHDDRLCDCLVKS